MVTCAKLINVFNQNDTNHENYLHLISNFVQQNNNCLWLRFFLIKQIFRRFGKQDLVELMKNNRFEWITQNVLSNQSKDEVNYYSFTKNGKDIKNTSLICVSTSGSFMENSLPG